MKLNEALDFLTIAGLGTAAYFGGEFIAPYVAQLSQDIGPLTAKVASIGALESLVAVYAGSMMNKHFHGTNKTVHKPEKPLSWDAEAAITYRDTEFGEHPYKTGV